MLGITDFKPSDPVTVVTDVLLFLEGMLFAVALFFHQKGRNHQSIQMWCWIGTFSCIGLFALFGALAHGTHSLALEDVLWPPTVIFGGLSFFWFNLAVEVS